MVSSISGNSSLQMISALNAFKSEAVVNNKPAQTDLNTSSGINLSDNDSLLKDINMTEIRDCASKVGETNLTDDDIKYGLTYGRSVIADYTA